MSDRNRARMKKSAHRRRNMNSGGTTVSPQPSRPSLWRQACSVNVADLNRRRRHGKKAGRERARPEKMTGQTSEEGGTSYGRRSPNDDESHGPSRLDRRMGARPPGDAGRHRRRQRRDRGPGGRSSGATGCRCCCCSLRCSTWCRTVRLACPVPGRGHGELIRERFGAGWAWLSTAGLAAATIGSLVTEFTGVAGIGELYGLSRALSLAARGGRPARGRRHPLLPPGGAAPRSSSAVRTRLLRRRGRRIPASRPSRGHRDWLGDPRLFWSPRSSARDLQPLDDLLPSSPPSPDKKLQRIA